MRSLRICIVTPGALGSNPRTVKEADALQEAGHNVTVISTRTLDLVDQRDEDILVRSKWQTRRLDLRNRTMWHMLRAKQRAHAKAFALTGRARSADLGFSPFTAPLMAAAKAVAADLYIAHYPAALPAAVSAARHHAAAYAFDAEDFHPGDRPAAAEYAAEQSMLRAIEENYLPGCVYMTAASPGIADAYAETYRILRAQVLLNVFPRSHAPKTATPTGTAVPGPSIYWFSQTIGPHRGLECAVEAIGLARSLPHLYLRGTPADGFLHLLEDIAAKSGASGRLHVLAPVIPSEMERLAAAYDLGLIAETDHTLNRQIALTNKLFSYFLAGLPTVASDITAHRAIAAEAAPAVRLFSTDDAKSLAAVMDTLLQDPVQLSLLRATAFELGQARYNWDTEKLLLLDLVDNLSLQQPSARTVERRASPLPIDFSR